MSTISDTEAAAGSSPRATLTQALWRARFQRLLSEMATCVEQSALSLALGERRELACALLDSKGRTVAEYGTALRAATLGAQVRAALLSHPALLPEKILAVSDPHRGGSDLSTLTLFTQVVDRDGQPLGYLAVSGECGDFAHPPAGPPERYVDLSSDALPPPSATPEDQLAELPPAVGPRYRGFQGPLTTSVAGLPRTLSNEGEPLTPTPLTDALLLSFAHKRREPIEALADLRAMRGALLLGQQQLRLLATKYGPLRHEAAQQLHHTELRLRDALRRLPGGVYAFADSLDDDGAGAHDVAIRVTLHIAPGADPEPARLTFDFRETADAVAGAMNTVPAVVHAAVRCALLPLLPPGVAENDGLLTDVRILLRPGSLLDAGAPHAVAAGASETALRLIDVVLGALSQAFPRPLQAASAGTASWVTLRTPEPPTDSALSSPTPRARVYLREALAGGIGGNPAGPAAQAASAGRHIPATSRHAIAAEIIEQRLPVRVLRCGVRANSGGGGIQPGGDGLHRELLLLADLHVELCGERRQRPPYGLGGGGPGRLGRDTLVRDGIGRPLPAKARLLLRAGDVLSTESPGGGGFGDPMRAAFYAALLG